MQNQIEASRLRQGQYCLVVIDGVEYLSVCINPSRLTGEAKLKAIAKKGLGDSEFKNAHPAEHDTDLFMGGKHLVTVLDVDIYLDNECIYRTWEEPVVHDVGSRRSDWEQEMKDIYMTDIVNRHLT